MTISELKEILELISAHPRVTTIRYRGVELVLSVPVEVSSEEGPSQRPLKPEPGNPSAIEWDKITFGSNPVNTLYDSPDAWPGGSKPVLHRKPPVDPDLK